MIGLLIIRLTTVLDGIVGITGDGIDLGMVGIDLIAHGIIGIIVGITVLLIIKGIMLYGIQVEEAAVGPILMDIELI